MDNVTVASVASTAQRAARHDYLVKLARAGLIVYGVIHLLIGVTAGQLAFGDGGQADQSGAMRTLADNPFGKAVLWTGAVGFAALALRWLVEAIGGSRGPTGTRQLGDIVRSIGKAVLFAGFSYLSVRFATGSGGQGEQGATAKIFELPGGQFIIGAIGVIIAGVGIAFIVKGVTQSFLDDLRAHAQSGPIGTAVTALGTVGHSAKGAAFVLVGALFVVAAVQHDPEEAGGLDQALKTLQEQPFGPWLLMAIGIGLAAFGIYCFAEARYARR